LVRSIGTLHRLCESLHDICFAFHRLVLVSINIIQSHPVGSFPAKAIEPIESRSWYSFARYQYRWLSSRCLTSFDQNYLLLVGIQKLQLVG
jgi:hypothetical protein